MAQCDFCSTELKKKWDWGFTSKDAVICRPCDKQGLGEDTDEDISSTDSYVNLNYIIDTLKQTGTIPQIFVLLKN